MGLGKTSEEDCFLNKVQLESVEIGANKTSLRLSVYRDRGSLVGSRLSRTFESRTALILKLSTFAPVDAGTSLGGES